MAKSLVEPNKAFKATASPRLNLSVGPEKKNRDVVFKKEHRLLFGLFALWLTCFLVVVYWVRVSSPETTLQWVLLFFIGIPAWVGLEAIFMWLFGGVPQPTTQRSGLRITLAVAVIVGLVGWVWWASQ